MRNVVMAVMLVAAGVSSSYVSRTGGSEGGAEALTKGKTPLLEGALPQPIDDPLDLLKDFLDPSYRSPFLAPGSCADPIDRLRDLLNSAVRPCAQPPAGKPEESNCAVDREFKDAPLNLNFLIATIPDPEKTHLGLYFDRSLEAIIFAAEEQGFSYDRYWLPWHVSHDAGNPDPLKQDILDGRAEGRHHKPGIIILRKTPKVSYTKDLKVAAKESDLALQESRNRALVIFLVGETPTAGINRHQFSDAAEYIRSFATCSHALGVLGPTFSGSATSLRAALRNDFPAQPLGMLVISGSASSRDALAGLADRTIHSDTFLWEQLDRFLNTHQSAKLRISGGVAVLKEAATDFGKELVDPSRSAASDIYYPREIYRLRNVYPEQTNSAATQVASLQQQLSLRLRDSRMGEETLPEFSDQTPLTQETVLLQISETLRRDHIGLAILTGTDVLDLLFLSRHLRALSPDVRLLLWGSDLLFVHGTDTLDFSGMLAISTYPLTPANHTWTDGPSPHYYFASNQMQGIYNAARLLLKPDAKDLREYSSPKEPLGANSPPVWLSIIGDDAYWPLGLLNDSGDYGVHSMSPGIQGQLDPGRPTRAWSSVFYLCSLLAMIYVGIYFYSLHQNAESLPRWCSFLHPLPHDALWWRPAYSFFMSLTLFLAYITLLVPVFRLGFRNHNAAWLVMLVVGTLVVVGFFAVSHWGLSWLSRKTVISIRVLGFLVVMLTVYFFVFGRFFGEESFFRALRSVQLGSGVGPNLPLFFLFLAFAWWASLHVQRARLVAEQRPQIPDIAANNAAQNIDRLNRWLEQPFLYVDRFGWVVAGVGTLATAGVAIPHIISVDGLLFDAAVCALLIPLSTLVFLTTYAFSRIWRALDRLLEALETQPIRFAFTNLPSDVSWSPLWQNGARKKSYATLIRSLESLRALHESEPDYYPGLSADIAELEKDLDGILAPVHQGVEEPIAETNEMQNLLSEITEKLSQVQRTRDWKLDYSESLEKIKKASGSTTIHRGIGNWFHVGKPADLEITSAPEDADPKDTPEILAAEVIALRYLAYIRYIMRHLRTLLSFITTAFILMTLALNSYPFQMLNLIRWSMTGLFILTAMVLLYAFQQMSRNEILRRVTDTPAGSIDTGFYTRAISVGALPLLAVVASHFPSVGRFLFSWVQPAIAALH